MDIPDKSRISRTGGRWGESWKKIAGRIYGISTGATGGGWKIQQFPPRYLPATDIVSSKKGPISQWRCFFFGGGVGGWFFEFIFPERNQCGEVHLTKKMEESLYCTWKICNHCPNFDTGSSTSINGICSFPKKHTLLSQDTIDKPRSMITMSFMSFMMFLRWQEPCVKKNRNIFMCQKKQETLQTP